MTYQKQTGKDNELLEKTDRDTKILEIKYAELIHQ